MSDSKPNDFWIESINYPNQEKLAPDGFDAIIHTTPVNTGLHVIDYRVYDDVMKHIDLLTSEVELLREVILRMSCPDCSFGDPDEPYEKANAIRNQKNE